MGCCIQFRKDYFINMCTVDLEDVIENRAKGKMKLGRKYLVLPHVRKDVRSSQLLFTCS